MMHKTFGCLLICLLLVGCAGRTQGRMAAQKGFGLERENERFKGPPATRLKNMLAVDHQQHGELALARNDLSLAKLHFTLANAKDVNFLPAYLGMAEVLLREQKYAPAEAVLKQALEKAPECTSAMVKLGILYRLQDEPDNALEQLTRAVELTPDDPVALSELAITYERSGKLSEAEQVFQKVVDLKPESAAALNNLGFNLLLAEKYQEAISALQDASMLEPKSLVAKNNLALAYTLNGEPGKALQLFEASVGKAAAYNNLGYLLMIQQHPDAAATALARAQKESPRYYARANENLELLEAQKNSAGELFN